MQLLTLFFFYDNSDEKEKQLAIEEYQNLKTANELLKSQVIYDCIYEILELYFVMQINTAVLLQGGKFELNIENTDPVAFFKNDFPNIFIKC